MSQHRTNPNAGWANLKELPTGPNGRRLCRRCQQEVPKGRRTFCSDTCVDEWKIRTNPGYVRAKVWERDHGVCQHCRLNTDAWYDEIRRTLPWDKANEAMRARGFMPYGHRWEADHIVPVSEGGGECGLEGYRTLCIPCHRAATNALRHRLKQQRTARAGSAVITATAPTTTKEVST